MALILTGSSGSTTLDSSAGLTFSDSSNQSAAASPYVLKNRIINGDMRIDQRNAGASVTPAAGTYTLDRWSLQIGAASKLSVQQNAGSVTPPAGFSNYLGITSTSAYSVGAAELFDIRQFIEGYNVADLAFGTANAKTITISFWVRSSLTGTFGGFVSNSAYNRVYVFNYTISSANTWEQKTVTIAGDTSGTWLTTNGAGLILSLTIASGTSYQGAAGSWIAGSYFAASGQTSVVGTNGATFYITGVQLEIGTSATPFERRLYNQELANCQRYYEVINADTAQSFWADLNGGNSVTAIANLFFRVTKRATPTCAQYGTYTTSNTSSPTINANTNGFCLFYQTSGTVRCYWFPTVNAGVTATAEL